MAAFSLNTMLGTATPQVGIGRRSRLRGIGI